MSPRSDRILLLACALPFAAFAAGAQTIGDYSRAQRLALESAMSQAAARSAGLTASASASAPAAAASTTPMPSTSAPPGMAGMPLPLAPAVQVSGVFASSASAAVAEVVVNATAYLLQAGQGVPGTSWQVESVAVDRVVLRRHAGASAHDAESLRKVYALPALR